MAQYPTTTTSILRRTTTAHSYLLLFSPHRHTHVTMNARQPEDNNAGNSNIDAGNSGDNDNNVSAVAAGNENAREGRGQRVQRRHSCHDDNDNIEYSYHQSCRRTMYKIAV